MKPKILSVLLTVILMLTLFNVVAFAEDTPVEVPEQTPVECSVIFKYTSDSVYSGGLTYEMYSDAILGEVGFKIVTDLPVGYVIYDDPETAHIDGIRINGTTTESLKVPIASDSTALFTVDVRVVYAEGILGDIARMSDGTYDWTQLLANPVVLLQLGYWALSILTLVVGMFASLFGKKVKVKTADDIASSVASVAETSLTQIKESITETVIAEFTPILQTILKDLENVVKAVTLSTSKSENAPIALLDVLQDTVSSTDVNALIDNVRQSVVSRVAANAKAHADNAATLHAIATADSTPTVVVEPVEEVLPVVETQTKSIF